MSNLQTELTLFSVFTSTLSLFISLSIYLPFFSVTFSRENFNNVRLQLCDIGVS